MTADNIILTGFMGCGKTTVGKLLSVDLNYIFIDTDQLIEANSGLTITEIFAQKGEESFRKDERKAASRLAKNRGQVISTGGGLMLDPENLATLGANGRVFCLVATPEEILRRISKSTEAKRPLLDSADPLQAIIELVAKRTEGYRKFEQIDTSGKSPREVADAILHLL